MRDGQGTRRRLLKAATAEFAARGLAGARVDRIAAGARVNKAQLYSYFGSKDGLFDAVIDEYLDMIVDTVPFTAEDLPGYAARLYDACRERPELVRLAAWDRLQRATAGTPLPRVEEHDARKRRAIAEAQRSGHVVASLSPADVLSIVTAISMAWSPAGPADGGSGDGDVDGGRDDSEHARRRRALSETVRRALVP